MSVGLKENTTLYLSPLQGGYSQIYMKQTEVFRSINGTESRRSLLNDTLIGVNAKYQTFNREQTEMMDSLLAFAKYNDDIIWIPLWFSRTTLTSAASTSSDVISVVDASLEGFSVDSYLMINLSRGITPVSSRPQIHGISSNDITLSGNASFPYPIGSEVVPIRQMKIDTVVKSQGQRVQQFNYNITAREVD